MQAVSTLYQTILADPGHRKEVKVVIAGVEYTEGNIVSIKTYGGLFQECGIGNTAAREIDMEILPIGTIPRQAKIEVFVRLVLGDAASEWLPKGQFFFSKRETNSLTKVMSVYGVDAMLKAEQTWLDESYETESWPMPAAAAVADITARMGVELDPRTALSSAFPVEYPVDEEGDMTMREVLERVAVANAGNWIITDSGKLLLVPLNSMPASESDVSYLITEFGNYITFGGYRIRV